MEIALGHGESLLSGSGPRDFCDLGHHELFVLDQNQPISGPRLTEIKSVNI